MNIFRKSITQGLRGRGVKTDLMLDTVPRALSRLISSSAFPQLTAATPTEMNFDSKVLAPDYQFLRNLVKSIPLVLHRPVPETKEKYFRLPLGTRFTAPSRELGLQMKHSFAHALLEKGLVVIELGFGDPKSHFMLELVEAMGCVPDMHSSTQGALVSLNLGSPLPPTRLPAAPSLSFLSLFLHCR
jgi:hypothetical protein